ncbi:trans-sulfuration enzyme family protein [Portibacter marinus]|uniref:trans-sulfuration enzyme family protein n=1 Tax=Portibacter marinus TaxID=2898660 RepID=UPI001F36F2A2|nr:aminotransferase class I/II-fold pyridoxal phosphate-dependent enzyme [Portibacter marinus]
MSLSFESICVKEPQDTKRNKPHILPIYATSSFEFENINEGIDIFTNKKEGFVYSRYANPTVESVAQKLAALESYGMASEAYAMMTSSGMSAISTLISGCLQSGDKILTQGNLYGGTTELIKKIFSRFGIEAIFVDFKDYDRVEAALKSDKSIKMMFLESPANPTLACVDLEILAQLGKKYGAYTAIDNTFCTPYLQQPLKFGIDFVVHSTTKYLNGHGNSIAGAVISLDHHAMKEKVWTAMKLLGTNCNPWDAWLTSNGLKTLVVRMEKHSANAMALAEFLDQNPKVKHVNYTGLKEHADHDLAKKQMRLHGGMMSFEVHGGVEAGKQVMNKIKMCTLAPTLGDVDTLILHPASMSHLNIPREVRLENGITDGLIRVSVGIEDIEDLKSDLGNALD